MDFNENFYIWVELVSIANFYYRMLYGVMPFSNFNDFDAKRAAFVNLLKKQDGFVKELEYRSADGKHYVGMTIYENAQKFQAIGINPAVMQSAEAGALFSAYPPMVNQFGLAYP